MKKLCQMIVPLLFVFTAQPIMAEKVRKMEVIVTDTERLTEGKIRLNLAEIAEQLAPYQAPVDLSAYVKLAGDEDGQTIQGKTGVDAARIEIGNTPGRGGNSIFMIGALNSGSAGTFYVGDTGVDAYSADDNSNFSIVNGLVYVYTDGVFFVESSSVRIVSLQTPPTTAADACTAGDTIDTATFHYYCYASGAWVRVAMATW